MLADHLATVMLADHVAKATERSSDMPPVSGEVSQRMQ